MPTSTTIEFENLSKSFGSVNAVSDLSFTVEPGRVTGLLGPNGAGKTTPLRMLLGLVTPTSGSATFSGTAYGDLDRPLATVGTALEASSFHPGRTARGHLRVYAAAAGIPEERVSRVLELVGLAEYGDRRVGGYSLGMRQRLGLAFALLGDPRVLVLDEPTNGLDPEGIRWIRVFLRELAEEGRTVLISSVSAFAVIATCAIIGLQILEFFGISLASFQVGGGMLLLTSALSMLNAQPAEAKTTQGEVDDASARASIAVVPLTIPLLTGPATMSTVVIYADQAATFLQHAALVGYGVVIALATAVCFTLAQPISRFLGQTGINVMTRLMGLILAALAVEVMATGLVKLFPALL